ncbi:MAG: four helix bundle protein [FCB group bacterium]
MILKNLFNFFVARGSLYEIETQIYLAQDQSYISKDESKKTLDKIDECKKLLNGFIKYYQTLKK